MCLASCASVTTTGDTDRLLGVMSYNIEYGHEGLDSVAAVIRESNADVVGLQEVDVHWSDRSNFTDQAALLAKATGMDYRFAPIYRLPNIDPSKPPREFGVALLSRYPIVAFTNHNITRHSTQDSTAAPAPMPGLLEAIVNVHGRKFRFFNVHLDYRREPTVRARQVAEIIDYIIADTIPTILTGDLNATPDSPEIQPLRKQLHDSWSAHFGPGFTYSATKPEKRIDYVLASTHVCFRLPHTLRVYASDHFPVFAEVIYNKPCRQPQPAN